ncbi:hypothetical protein [Catenulispora rubra]|uniref:hypothetical protein n=1 Tax=Catenulispora rubra TaxID=280293 RepID=UPI0018926D76|nr:hypothetical protein [Catenulispora rubra]
MSHAENLVRDAWLGMLHGECDYTGAEMHAASAHCDTARRHLAVALLGCDPDAIAMAYADLESRLVGARIAACAYEQARAALDHELRATYRRAADRFPDGRFADDRFSDEYASRRRLSRQRDESVSGHGAGWVRALLILGWLSHLAVSWLARLAAGRRL